MEKEREIIEERKRKLKNWLNNRYNIWIILVIMAAIIIRIYYVNMAGDQTMWWDEAEYMATAKYWALGVPYDINQQRPPLFQLLAAILLKFNLSEPTIKFILVVLPSAFLVLCVYWLGRELFNKRVALFATAGTAFVWSLLFWTARFQPDFLSVTFQLLSILFFWKLFKTNKTSNAIYAGFFAALAFYFKISGLLVPLSILIFVLFKDGLSFIRNKRYWISLAAFIVTMIPFAIWQYLLFGNPTAFAPSYIGGTGIGQGWDFGWMTLNFFYIFPKIWFFILFLIGLGLAIFKFGLSFDILLKDKNKRLNPYIFSITILIVLVLFYIFYIRGTIEDRWVFLMIPFIMYFSGLGLDFISNKIGKYSKLISAIFILLIFAFFIYAQTQHATQLVKIKKDTYLPVKESALFIKDISSKNEIVLSVSYTQTTTYSERKVITYAEATPDEFHAILEKDKPSYIVVSILEPHHPTWIIQQVTYNDGWGIIMPYFNSSIIVSSNNQIVGMDVKPSIVTQDKYKFDLIYPEKQFNGLFVYRITYL